MNEALGGTGLDLDVPLARIRTGLRKLAAVLPGDHTLGLATPHGQWLRNLDLTLDGLRLPHTVE
ncbi:hypothetical protein FNH07_24875 [Amycolatopsis bartoniae]|nr:hypothetical protein FNH07_24875 [Amycolatopsis bartoniae]